MERDERKMRRECYISFLLGEGELSKELTANEWITERSTVE